MPLEKEPFKNYTLDEEKKPGKREIISVSLNKEERIVLDTFKEASKIPHDSKALKFLAMVGVNVIHATIGPHNLRYLASQERTRIP